MPTPHDDQLQMSFIYRKQLSKTKHPTMNATKRAVQDHTYILPYCLLHPPCRHLVSLTLKVRALPHAWPCSLLTLHPPASQAPQPNQAPSTNTNANANTSCRESDPMLQIQFKANPWLSGWQTTTYYILIPHTPPAIDIPLICLLSSLPHLRSETLTDVRRRSTLSTWFDKTIHQFEERSFTF